MKFVWDVSKSDIDKVTDFVKKHRNPDIDNLLSRNINHVNVAIDKDSLLKTMLICLLSADTNSNPQHTIDAVLSKKPFLLSYKYVFSVQNIETLFQKAFEASGITKYLNKVPAYFSRNFYFLEGTDWELEQEINNSIKHELTNLEERELADKVDQGFKGFGSKEARKFLLLLGITRYEIPIDHQLTKWLVDFEFPVKFSRTALQDKSFYHFVLDGIRILCDKAGIYPCVLYFSILSGAEVLKKECYLS